jgi:hypothetical protein
LQVIEENNDLDSDEEIEGKGEDQYGDEVDDINIGEAKKT